MAELTLSPLFLIKNVEFFFQRLLVSPKQRSIYTQLKARIVSGRVSHVKTYAKLNT